MQQVTWLYKDPAKTTPEQALRIVCRVLRKNDAAHIAMALKHRQKYPDYPAGYCGLTKWIKRVLKANELLTVSGGPKGVQ